MGCSRHRDGAGLTAPDPQCNGLPYRLHEKWRGCGLGFELGLLLPLLLGIRARRRRADR